MKISLLHPSRNRTAAAEETAAEWLGKSSGLHPIEYIVSVDDSDGHIPEYRRLAERVGAQLVLGPNRNYVEACNRAALAATGDLLVIVSDDFGCPQRWDNDLALAIGERRDVAVLVDDGRGAKTMTLPIVGRALYRRNGYLVFPGYIHLFCDNDLEELSRRLGKLVEATHLLFPHRHHTIGGSPYDETYRKSERTRKHGAHVLDKRRVRDFDLRPRTLRDAVKCGCLDLRYGLLRPLRLLPAAARRRLMTFARQRG